VYWESKLFKSKKAIMKKLAILACLVFMSSMLYAQKDSSTVKVRIEKIVDGKRQIIEKEIDATGMSDEERDVLIERMQDSLIGDVNVQKKMKIVIEDDPEIFEGEQEESDFEFHSDNNRFWKHYDSDGDKEVRITRKQRKGGNDWADEFEWEMERLGDNMKMLGEELPQHIQKHLPRVYAWTDNVLAEVGSSPIRSLDVFPNQPDSDVINVKFYAPEQGDINITVLDTKGQIVAKKESKAFQGEFVGQINLKKGIKGTHFVIVSQGDDGVSRKVVLD
jgi:hypothetical protein